MSIKAILTAAEDSNLLAIQEPPIVQVLQAEIDRLMDGLGFCFMRDRDFAKTRGYKPSLLLARELCLSMPALMAMAAGVEQ